MSAPILLRQMIWKEYQQQRGLWLILCLFAFVVQLIVVWSAYLDNRLADPQTLLGIAVGFPALFAVGCGATLFSGEHESGTYETLRALPVTARQILAGKFTGALAGLIAMPLVLCVATAFFGRSQPHGLAQLSIIFGGLVASLELFAWGVFFSLRTQRPLWSVVFAAGTASFLGFIALPALWLSLSGGSHEDPYFVTLPLRSVVAFIVLALDMWLALGWLDERPRHLIPRFWSRWTDSPRSVSRATMARRETHSLLRLVWQEWRQSRGLIATIFGFIGLPSIALFFIGFVSPVQSALTFVFWTLPFTASLLGGCIFFSDQSRHCFRFFAERGINARRVWLSRQLVWGTVLLLLIVFCLLYLAALGARNPTSIGLRRDASQAWAASQVGNYTVPASILQVFLGVLGLSFVGYAAAQVGSMFVRSGLVGLFVGLFLSFITCFWCVLMAAASVPLSWSAAPLPLLLLWSTWVRAPDWVAEQTTARARLRAGLALATPLLLVLGVISYRVFDIPAVTLPSSDELTRQVTDEERATRQMYDEAYTLLGAEKLALFGGMPGITKSPKSNLEPLGQAKPEPDAKQKAAGIEKFLQASRQPTCIALPALARPLTVTVLSHAAQLDSAGNHEEAKELYFAVTRFARHLYQTGPSQYLLTGDWVEGAAFEGLVQWCAKRNRSAIEIRQVRERLESECFSFSPRRDLAILSDRAIYLELLAGNDRDRGNSPDQLATARQLLKYMPWEKVRNRRLVDYHTYLLLQQLTLIKYQILGQQQSLIDFAHSERQIRSSILLPMIIGDTHWHAQHVIYQETIRRAARIRLALLQWRAENGELPEGLHALSAYGHVPNDPFTGEPFIYRPRGVDSSYTKLVTPTYSPDPNVQDDVEAGTPFIWSAGPHLVYRAPTTPIREDALHVAFWQKTTGSQVTSMYSLWQLGWSFEIP